MQSFPQSLEAIKQSNPDLFDEEARRPPDERDLTIESEEFEFPDEKELGRKESLEQRERSSRPPGLPDPPRNDDPWDREPESEDYDRDNPRAREERRGFENRPTRAGLETLAVYLPFHFYPEGEWGVRFFEAPIVRYTDRLHNRLRNAGVPISWLRTLKLAVYSVARHEFTHYLTELHALQLELVKGGRVYRPYWDSVYKPTYPGADCLEETVANYWTWHNALIKNPAARREVFRDVLRATPALAYSLGADLNANEVREFEDKLAAQVTRCVPRPSNPPAVWGMLPRPYVQPWTRYENVTYAMNRSAGGILASYLNPKPARKTIRIFHR